MIVSVNIRNERLWHQNTYTTLPLYAVRYVP